MKTLEYRNFPRLTPRELDGINKAIDPSLYNPLQTEIEITTLINQLIVQSTVLPIHFDYTSASTMMLHRFKAGDILSVVTCDIKIGFSGTFSIGTHIDHEYFVALQDIPALQTGIFSMRVATEFLVDTDVLLFLGTHTQGRGTLFLER